MLKKGEEWTEGHTFIKLSVWRDHSHSLIPRCSFCTLLLIPMCYKSVTDVIYITARCRCPCAQCAVGHWGENCFVPRCSAAHTDLSPHPCWIPHLFEIKMQNIPRTTRSPTPSTSTNIYAKHHFEMSAKKGFLYFSSSGILLCVALCGHHSLPKIK